MHFYERLEGLSRKWWFYLVLYLIPSFIPPYSLKKGFITGPEIGKVTGLILRYSLAPYRPYQPLLHLILILMILLVLVLGNRFGRIFTAFMGLHYIFISILQGTAHLKDYGLSMLLGNMLWFFFIASLLLWEAMIRRTDFTFHRVETWKLWVIPLAILAFWCPMRAWRFDPIDLIKSDSTLAFCMMTPIYLSILSFLIPRVNLPMVRVMSFIGSVMGFYNMFWAIVIGGSGGAWVGFIHIPLLSISIYSFILSIRAR